MDHGRFQTLNNLYITHTPDLPLKQISLCCAVAGLLTLCACSGQDSQAQQNKTPPAVPVTVAAVEKKTMPVRIQGIGNVEAYASVALKALIDGQITRAYFKEGQDVQKGALLFEIDARAFEAQLHQAEANLLRDQAQLENANAQERRYLDLLNKNFVSKEFYAQIRTNRDAAEATASADRAAVKRAKVQLEYTQIRSPINGRTGKIMIQEGNLVKANDTVFLVVINQISPIYVNFSVPEQNLGEIQRHQAAGKLSVQVTLPNTNAAPLTGELAFVDNAVDTTTGTIKLKALFENKERVLWPGQFANVALTLYEQADALVVPSQAVQIGPKGQYVYVVKDATAEVRAVAVAWADGGQSVIAKGLAAGETVVTNGQLRLTPGTRVEYKTGS
ncbi:MAG: efflux RND transporter periplasmic adaptor subunit [Burkholderiales bacterium]